MKVVFISALKFGYECVKAVLDSRINGINIESVFTLSDEFRDRSGFYSFEDLQEKYGVKLNRVDDINSEKNIEAIRRIEPDLIIVIGWSFLIKEEIMKIPKLGIIGNHPSLLPKYRGNAPIPWAIINGLSKSGSSFFFLSDKPDAGDIVAQGEFSIGADDYADDVYNKALEVSKKLCVDMLESFRDQTVKAMPQDHEKASTMPKRKPADGIINWDKEPEFQYAWIRGLSHPYPGAFTFMNGKKVSVWKAKPMSYKAEGKKNGEVIDINEEGILIVSGGGSLLLTKLQKENEEELGGKEFAEKYDLDLGFIFG
jgi:methionyl-tRNA formyltransferase